MAWSNTHYDALDCTVMAGGVYITGLSETMVTGSKDEEFFTTEVGAQGDVVENENNNPLGTITLTIQSTCPQKGYLLGLARSGQHFPMWVINKNLGERMGGTNCRIKNFPELEHAKEAGDREIEVQVFDYTVEGI